MVSHCMCKRLEKDGKSEGGRYKAELGGRLLSFIKGPKHNITIYLIVITIHNLDYNLFPQLQNAIDTWTFLILTSFRYMLDTLKINIYIKTSIYRFCYMMKFIQLALSSIWNRSIRTLTNAFSMPSPKVVSALPYSQSRKRHPLSFSKRHNRASRAWQLHTKHD